MVKSFVGMGSNLGDGNTTLVDAWTALGGIDGITLLAISSPYKTAPVDMDSQHWFTNAVGCLNVELSPLALLQALLGVENAFGRTRNIKKFGYQDRSLDLDLLYYGDVIMDDPELILPHPRITERLFVLVPFSELDPDYKDIVSGKTIADLEQQLRGRIGNNNRKDQEIIRDKWDDRESFLVS